MSLDASAGCAKKPYKNRVFWHTLLLDAEETEKRKKTKKKQKKRLHPKNGGPSKRAGSSSTFFLSKETGFSESSKTPIFIAFPEKMGGHHFFSKRLCFKKDTFRRAKKNDNFLVPFRQKCLRRCQSKKRGGWGGEAPPKKEERSRVMAQLLLFLLLLVVVFCFFVVVLVVVVSLI